MSFKTIGDYAKVQGGFAYKSQDFKEAGYPVIKIKNIGFGRIRCNDLSYVSKEIMEKTKSYLTNEDDILISMTGSNVNQPESIVGRVALVTKYDKRFLINQRVGRLVFRAPKEINGKYLFYVLSQKENQYYLALNASGSANQVNINSKLIESIKIRDVSFEDSNKIAHILSTLDNKIELNKKMNQTLESIAQAIFKSWFVDFDPVHAKANAQSVKEYDAIAKDLGISREILDLFPSEFEESELGLIPKGWSSSPFGDFLEKSIGGDWGKDLPDAQHIEKVRIIRGTDLPNLKICSLADIPTRYVSPQKLNQRKLKDGDIVIEISGGTKNQPTGRSSYITNYMLNVLGGVVEPASFCRLFRPINPKVGLILGLHLKQIYDENKTWKYQNQSTGISNFQTTVFLNNELVINPSNAIIDSFFSLVRPMIDMALPRENLVLENIKNTLLPKLLTGNIDVSNINLEPEHD